MEHDWKMLHSNQQRQPKQWNDKFDASFKRGSTFLWGGMTPFNNLFAKNIIWIHKVYVINNSAEIIWIFEISIWINAYLTKK